MMKIEKLQSLLENDNAFLVSGEVSRQYLTSFSSSDGYLVIKKDDARFFVDARYFEDAEKKISVCAVELFRGFNSIKSFLGNDIKNIIVESDCVTLSEFEKYKKTFSDKNILSDNNFDSAIKNMRSVKDESEIINLKKAQSISEQALEETLAFINLGVTENQVAAFLEYSMRKHGGEKVSFDTIVVSGKKSSVPHGVPTDKIIESGDFVTIDFGTVFNGYHSDMTRTVVIGKASEKQLNVYNAVLEAQERAIKEIKPEIKCSQIDKAARDYLDSKNLAEYFCHSTGHGVGLEIHEFPTVSSKNDCLLKAGNVITVEPGVYIPGEFGVRIEDFGVVTKDGFENFTKAPKHLIEIKP